MYSCRLRIRVVLWLAAVLVWTLIPVAAQAQIGGFGGGGLGGGGFGGGGFGGGGFGGGGLGGGGAGNNQNAGVIIDAQGVLKMQMHQDPTGRAGRQRIQAAMANLNRKLTKFSQMRKISLNRLEKAVAARLAAGQQPDDEMKNLAGMLRIQYVFFYPDSGDIVLAGPAEGFAEDLAGRVRGLTTGWPALQLQDLIVALRAYPPGNNAANVIGCSIDPTQEGLQRMQQALAAIGRQIRPGDGPRIAKTLRQALGYQNVTIDGVSPKTHFAQVMVEADYRMKLIGIGLEKPPVKIVSYVARANPRSVARNALQRWYFTPFYKCLRVAEDGQAMEFRGWGVRLIGQSELIKENGGRVAAGGQNKASEVFCKSFTDMYPKLASVVPVYAQLRNMIDLSVAGAFIQAKDFYGQSGWNLGVFADESKLPVETYEAPQKVESAVNIIWKGSTLMTPIGGGVEIHPQKAVRKDNWIPDEGGTVAATRKKITLSQLREGQWWWD